MKKNIITAVIHTLNLADSAIKTGDKSTVTQAENAINESLDDLISAHQRPSLENCHARIKSFLPPACSVVIGYTGNALRPLNAVILNQDRAIIVDIKAKTEEGLIELCRTKLHSYTHPKALSAA